MRHAGPRILSVGDAIVDVVTPPLPPLPRGDFQGLVDGFSLIPGGNATNFALQSAALGSLTSFVGCVGKDAFAGILREAYRNGGVDAHLRTDPRQRTGTTVALTWSDGSRALITAPGANASLRERDVPPRLLERADHMHRAGFWWTSRLIGTSTVRILARARRHGATTSLDISTDPQGWSATRVDAVKGCLPYVDTFFGNEVEVCAVAGADDPFRAAKDLCRLGVSEVVIHRGAKGATYVAGPTLILDPAFAVNPENPTGCGDVFNAAFVHSRLSGAEAPRALRFANACAALHLQNRLRPYPSSASVRRFLAVVGR